MNLRFQIQVRSFFPSRLLLASVLFFCSHAGRSQSLQTPPPLPARLASPQFLLKRNWLCCPSVLRTRTETLLGG